MQQAARDKQQRQTGQSTEHMGDFDQRQGNMQGQNIGRFNRRGRHARGEQPDAGDEDENGEEHRRKPRRRAPDRRIGRAMQFMAHQQQCRQCQWQQEIHAAEQDQGTENRLGRRMRTVGQQHDGFENAETTRNMAQYPQADRDREVDQEARERNRRFGHQAPQCRCAGRQIDDRNDHLLHEQPRGRQVERRPMTDAQSRPHPAQCDESADSQQGRPSSALENQRRQRQQSADVFGARDHAGRAEHRYAQPERAGIETDDAENLTGFKSGRGVKPHAHRATGHHAQSNGISHRVSNKGRQHDRSRPHPGAQVPKRGEIVAGQCQVAEQGGQNRHDETIPRRRLHGARERLVVQALDQMPQSPQHRHAEHDGREHEQREAPARNEVLQALQTLRHGVLGW